jgi:caa(3)-type oxidase subunit IV
MSAPAGATNPYRAYFVNWIILLVITVAMLAAERLQMPPWFLIAFLLAFMVVKATMIAGTFMHLRFEKASLAVMVAAGLIVTSLILFAYITPEAASVLDKARR